jgi:hypothetical protein
MSSGTGLARTAATISGAEAVTSFRLRVKTRTSSPDLCTWTRAPSTFHSNAAGAERAQRSGDIGGRLREHRRNGLHQREGELAKAVGAFGQRCKGHRNDPVRNHGGLPYCRRRQRCRRRDGVDHQRFERTLTQLAQQQSREEVAFSSVARAKSSERMRTRSPFEPAP